MDLHLVTLKIASFYLLHNVSSLIQCRKLSCGTVVCKHFPSYQGYPSYRWDLIWWKFVVWNTTYFETRLRANVHICIRIRLYRNADKLNYKLKIHVNDIFLLYIPHKYRKKSVVWYTYYHNFLITLYIFRAHSFYYLKATGRRFLWNKKAKYFY
jgi:hypothetical protein